MTINYMELPFFSKGHYNTTLSKITNHHFIPGYDDIFRALNQPKSTTKTKVLILGQDPYPTPGHANGLAFSVSPTVNPLPRSLKNIFRELVDDIRCPQPLNGDLTPWAKEGVLLLNTSLTTEPFKTNAHKGLGWEKLAEEVIIALSEDTSNRVFILWGRQAQAYEPLIDQSKHLILKSAHPSPLSANYGFFGSKPFSKANTFLKAPVNWSLEGQYQPPPPKKKKRAGWEPFDTIPSADYVNATSQWNDLYIAQPTINWGADTVIRDNIFTYNNENNS